MNNRDVRRVCGWSRERAAVEAGVSSSTARVFEADPDSVGPLQRGRLQAVYLELHRKAQVLRGLPDSVPDAPLNGSRAARDRDGEREDDPVKDDA